jgi:hypothetical protein
MLEGSWLEKGGASLEPAPSEVSLDLVVVWNCHRLVQPDGECLPTGDELLEEELLG